jgi:hypothetical protein
MLGVQIPKLLATHCVYSGAAPRYAASIGALAQK